MSENQTKEILDELYDFMQIPYDLDAQNTTLGYLMHGESRATHGQYYALFRGRDFDPNHWTKDLSQEVKFIDEKIIALFSCPKNFSSLQHVSQVEKWCGGVIQELGYHLLNATTMNAASVNNVGNQNSASGNMSPR